MKSGIRNNKTLKLISATAVTLFSLLSVFVATYAWFSLNKDVEPTAPNMNIEPVSGRLSKVYFHAFDDDEPSDETFVFNKTPFITYEYNWSSGVAEATSTPSEESWYMGDYTSLDKNHPLLILFELGTDYSSGGEGDIYIRARTTVGGFLGERNSDKTPKYSLPQTQVNDEDHPDAILMKQSGGKDYYALSSVVEFRNRTFSDSEYTTFLGQNTGSTLSFASNSFVEETNNNSAFTNIDNSTDAVTFNKEPLVYQSDASTTVKYIALIVEYSSDAIGYIYSTYLGDSGLNSYDSLLNFACDWSYEVY